MYKTQKFSNNISTIAALATPPGNSGVGIIRISGPNSRQIARDVLQTKTIFIPRVATLINHVIVIYFKAPESYTGEDVVELQCHGGQLLLDKILTKVLSLGAVLAQPGEFSRRALLNGKMSLDQAEAVISVINAQSNAELAASSQFLTGEFATRMKDIETRLVEISAEIEGALDHPDEVELPNISNDISEITEKIKSFTAAVETSNYIYNGIRVAILGKPNVGKSTLFNALLGTNRSIVTDIPGTTTDTVSETLEIEGFRVRLIDTAGMRKGRNKIEQLGIERTKQALDECDIAITVGALEVNIDKPHIVLPDKPDLSPKNIEKIKAQIIEKTVGNSVAIESRTVANLRQQSELRLALEALEAIKGNSPDMLASDIQTALFHIGNITGTNATEAVLDQVFARFCLGK